MRPLSELLARRGAIADEDDVVMELQHRGRDLRIHRAVEGAAKDVGLVRAGDDHDDLAGGHDRAHALV